MKTYKYKINQLESNQIFCFGSNESAIQGGGSALFAVKRGWCQQLAECFSANYPPSNIVFEEEFSTLLTIQKGFEI